MPPPCVPGSWRAERRPRCSGFRAAPLRPQLQCFLADRTQTFADMAFEESEAAIKNFKLVSVFTKNFMDDHSEIVLELKKRMDANLHPPLKVT